MTSSCRFRGWSRVPASALPSPTRIAVAVLSLMVTAFALLNVDAGLLRHHHGFLSLAAMVGLVIKMLIAFIVASWAVRPVSAASGPAHYTPATPLDAAYVLVFVIGATIQAEILITLLPHIFILTGGIGLAFVLFSMPALYLLPPIALLRFERQQSLLPEGETVLRGGHVMSNGISAGELASVVTLMVIAYAETPQTLKAIFGCAKTLCRSEPLHSESSSTD